MSKHIRSNAGSTVVESKTQTTGVVDPAIIGTPDVPPDAGTPDVPPDPVWWPDGAITFTDPDGTATVHVPGAVRTMAAAFRDTPMGDIVAASVESPDGRAARVRLAARYRAALETVPGFNPTPKHNMSVVGSRIGDFQTDAMIACAMAYPDTPLIVTRGATVAMWDAGIPDRACPYIDRPRYGRSTPSDMLNHRHPGAATFGGGVRFARAIRVFGVRFTTVNR